MLLFIDKDNKVSNADYVDTIISVEIPDEVRYPRLFSIVKQFMIHGPYGKQNINSPCMDSKTKQCTKNFPKEFNEQTNFNSNGYPNYRRSNDVKQISFSKQKKEITDL